MGTRKTTAPAVPDGAAAMPQEAGRGTPRAAAAALNAWFEEHCRDSVVSRSTPHYNRIVAGLRDMLGALLDLDQEGK